jgi:hypothetical protein
MLLSKSSGALGLCFYVVKIKAVSYHNHIPYFQCYFILC